MLPKGWVETKLGDVATIQSGYAFKSEDYASSGSFLIRIGNVQDGHISQDNPRYVNLDEKTSNFSLMEGDVLISLTGNIGRVSLVPVGILPAALNQRVGRIFFSKNTSKDLFIYFLRSFYFRSQINNHARGAAQQNISPNEILTFSVPLPPLAEQRRIVAKLDSLTVRIARARAELERVRTLSFRAWKSVINQSFQKFKCDNVPLKQIAQITGGLTKNAKRSSLPLQVPYLRVANVYANELRLSDVAEIGCSEKEYKKTKLERNDLLIVEGNGSIDQVGRAARWNGEIDGCTHQNHLIRIRPYESMSSDFLMFFLESSPGRKYIETSASSTSGLHTLSISKIGNFLCPLPSRPLQDLTVKYLNLCRDRLSKQRIEIDRALALLDRLESSLLAKAFRGELVPQDPTDEPASVLLDRIRTERAAVPKPGRKRKA